MQSTIPAPKTLPQSSPTQISPRSAKSSTNKSVWRRYHKVGSISDIKDWNKRHPAAAKMRAKLQRLAHKYSSVSVNSINTINKPDYDNLTGSGSIDLSQKIPSYWKSLRDEVGYSEQMKVSDNRNETTTMKAALSNVTYSETVHDITDGNSVSDGQESVFVVTGESAVREKGRETPKNETRSTNKTAGEIPTNGNNSTKVDTIRKRRFDVAANEIPTFPLTQPPARTGSGMIFQNPGIAMENMHMYQPGGYSARKGIGRHISQNERYSKVGRDPPFWVPVEPIEGAPVLREPAHKDMIVEEPYEPIPPLAKNDRTHHSWKPEPDVTSSVNRTTASVRRRPEAKEGGPSQLGKIASPLEREWIRAAEVATATVAGAASQNVTVPTSGFHRKETENQPTGHVRKVSHSRSKSITTNQTEQKPKLGKSGKSQSNEETAEANISDRNDCSAASWRNVRLIQDALTGGFYVIQAKTRTNCAEQDETKPDEKQKQINRNEDVTLKSEKHDTTGQAHSAETHGRTSADEVAEAGWMFFGQGGQLVKDRSKHPSEDKLHDSSSSKDFRQDPTASSKDTDSQQVQLEAETSPVDQFGGDAMKYFVVGKHPQTGQDSTWKDAIASLNKDDDNDNAVDQDLISNPESPRVIVHSKTLDGVLWQPLPLPEHENLQNVEDDIVETDSWVMQRANWNASGTLENTDGHQQTPGIRPADVTTSEKVRPVAPAAFRANTRRRVSAISGQSVTWGNCVLVLSSYDST